MATMGTYCKAYPIASFRAFGKWTEDLSGVSKDTQTVDDQEIETQRELTDDDYLFLHETYIVADGIFLDENIIFDKVTLEWKAYCEQTLGFAVPAVPDDIDD
jgi:hypothetical protein